jgi:hypothetical protein
MTTCYVVRSSRPTGLFSFDFLDGLSVRLRRPHLREAPAGFGLEHLATAFMYNPGYVKRIAARSEWAETYFFEDWLIASGLLVDRLPTDCTSRDRPRLPVRIRTCTSTASSPNSLGNGKNGWALTTA